ncbi:pilus assembly protein [Tabrizicola sp. J26]|uniref:TadE/TadG family type IV pilus assembly protein n=1 Tax=Alitabrizicola rongguiensis TaxID=2909234 RepID=UPI001F2D6643|nr:TadE family protein [Tabrizicola rongguiensis]MCF1710967.1 pilus assembly protein [Tabrizicola rongguiensis]
MSGIAKIRARFRPAQTLLSDETGAALPELALVLPVFLLLIFGLIDFGRMGYEFVMANKATDLAARLAATLPPACPGVATENLPGVVPVGTVAPRFGTGCASAAAVCAAPATVTCTAAMDTSTASVIWDRVEPLMPSYSAPGNLTFSYSYDPNLGFLGGPYVPVVTVEITGLDFQFASPLGAMATLAGGNWEGFAASIPFPTISVSLPGEDLAQGEAG